MPRFHLSTFLALPIVIASCHFAIIRPFAAGLLYSFFGVLLMLIALTSKQTGTQLDAKGRLGFTYWSGCLLTCVLILVTIETARKVSYRVDFWAWQYAWKSKGY